MMVWKKMRPLSNVLTFGCLFVEKFRGPSFLCFLMYRSVTWQTQISAESGGYDYVTSLFAIIAWGLGLVVFEICFRVAIESTGFWSWWEKPLRALEYEAMETLVKKDVVETIYFIFLHIYPTYFIPKIPLECLAKMASSAQHPPIATNGLVCWNESHLTLTHKYRKESIDFFLLFGGVKLTQPPLKAFLKKTLKKPTESNESNACQTAANVPPEGGAFTFMSMTSSLLNLASSQFKVWWISFKSMKRKWIRRVWGRTTGGWYM